MVRRDSKPASGRSAMTAEISVAAAFPRLHALEQQFGSLLKGQIQGAKERRQSAGRAKRVAGSLFDAQ